MTIGYIWPLPAPSSSLTPSSSEPYIKEVTLPASLAPAFRTVSDMDRRRTGVEASDVGDDEDVGDDSSPAQP
jgi:hypothetical protein